MAVGADGRQLVLLTFHTPLRSQTYFIEPRPAEEIAAGLAELARKARLVLPPAGGTGNGEVG